MIRFNEGLGTANLTLAVWIAGALAAVFFAVVIWDAIYQYRRHVKYLRARKRPVRITLVKN
ncbi:MAG TPA: hypothetical protein VFB72_16520 [Verrucomicrobiae bacterium]|nr:hypothetical protein [Verrucomicrobiae bacterium]